MALYSDRAQLAKPDFAVTERNAAAVAELCRKLEGMPLAIEMAAAWVKTLPPARMLERLERQLELLVSRRRDLPPRHQSLRATIEWSYELLSPEQQACFGRLSVFRGGGSLEAAEAVCGGEGLRLLSELQEQSLVVIAEGQTETRFRLLEPLREYGAEKLRERGEEEGARNQHLAYFLELAEESAQDLQGADPEAALGLLGSEMDNLRAAMAWAQTPAAPPDASLRLTAALWPFWEMRGYHTEGREHVRAALGQPGLPDAPARAQLLLGAATLAFVQVELEEALALGQESLERFRALDDPRGMASALLLLGHVSLERDEIAAARALLAEGLEYCRQSGWTQGSALACVHLGMAAMKQGDPPLARSLLEQGFSLAEAAGDAPTVALSLHNLGYLALQTGDTAHAGTPLEKSLEIRRRLGHKHQTSLTLRCLGQLARHQRDPVRAVAYLEEAVATCREQGNRTHLAIALYELGNVLYEHDAFERARPAYAESLDLFTQADSGWVPGARNNLGSTLFHLGDPIRAQELHREALRLYQRRESAEGIAWSLERLGVVEARHGDARKAVQLLAASSAVREVLGIPMARWDQADWDQAVASLRAGLKIRHFDAAWAEGRALTPAEAICVALAENEIPRTDRQGS